MSTSRNHNTAADLAADGQLHHPSILVPPALALALVLGIAACSSSDDATSETTTTQAPQTEIMPDDTVQMVARMVSKNDGSDTITVSFTGAIEDNGTARQESTDGPGGESGAVEFQLAGGTMTASFEEHDYQMNFDEGACTAQPTSTAVITVTGGTGIYAGASGTLNATTEGRVVGATDDDGACLAQSQPPLRSDVTISATGVVTFGL